MTEVMAKGTNFVYAKRYLEMKDGEEVFARIINSLSAGSKAVWTGPLLVSSSYPFSAFKEMMSARADELRTVRDSEISGIYEYIADQSLNKLYKIFFSFTNPSFAIKNYPRLWSMFFDSGSVEVPAAEKGHAVVKFLLPEIFNDWLPPASLGYSKKAVEMAGGKNLALRRISFTKRSEGLWESVYDLQWTE